jgi:hypothetical protein
MSNPEVQTKSELVRRIDGAWAELESSVLSLRDADLDRPGKDGWSIKDHVAHLAAWELSLAALLRGSDRLAAVGLPGDLDGEDQENAVLQRRYRGLSVLEVRALIHGSHHEVRNLLAGLTDADLARPYSDFQTSTDRSEPVVGWIVGNTYEHVEEHLGWLSEELRRPRTASVK